MCRRKKHNSCRGAVKNGRWSVCVCRDVIALRVLVCAGRAAVALFLCGIVSERNGMFFFMQLRIVWSGVIGRIVLGDKWRCEASLPNHDVRGVGTTFRWVPGGVELSGLASAGGWLTAHPPCLKK